MKKHAIIPIFIAHRGCPNMCVFCNQREITARTGNVTGEEVRNTIETWLSTLEKNPDIETIEVSFYGGSFTGLPIEEQNEYLEIAKEYKDKGRIHKIHMSTRPDYIDEKILDNLKKYEADTIELGVQSFDEEVLKLSNRGHTVEKVYESCNLIKEYGFELGIQLMVGLPGDTLEKSIYSAKETVKLQPSLARIYPTIVLDDTELYNMYVKGTYIPLSRAEAILRSKEIYKILFNAGITIMRVGLKSTDLIKEGGKINGGTYHPAFRQLVEGAIAREEIEPQLKEFYAKIPESEREFLSGKNLKNQRRKVNIYSNSMWLSNVIGNCKENKLYFENKYPLISIKYKVDDSLENMAFKVEFEELKGDWK